MNAEDDAQKSNAHGGRVNTSSNPLARGREVFETWEGGETLGPPRLA
jgi:hypothetical protein